MPTKNLSKFSFIDLFAGIGGFRLALEKLGGKCIGFSEIDKDAIKTYKSNFHLDEYDETELGSVTDLNVLPKCDVIVGGVPCQSWSVAGKMRGFEDPRGQLWFDTIRLVKINKPKVFIFENVKGLADPRNKENLDLITKELSRCGYKVFHKVQNSYDFGLPQNRERIFIVGIKSDQPLNRDFEFKNSNFGSQKLHQFLDDLDSLDLIKNKFSPNALFGGKIPLSRNKFQKVDEFNDFFVLCDTRNGHTTIHSWEIIDTSEKEKQICMAILKNRRKKIYGSKDGNPMSLEDIKHLVSGALKKDIDGLIKKNILRPASNNTFDLVNSKNSAGINNIYRIYLPNSHIISTLTATGTKDFVATKQVSGKDPSEYKRNFINEILVKKNYRQVSSREAGKLQGFPQDFQPHENVRLAMKQFGNAVSVPVVESTMLSVIETGIFGDSARKHQPITKKIKTHSSVFSLNRAI